MRRELARAVGAGMLLEGAIAFLALSAYLVARDIFRWVT